MECKPGYFGIKCGSPCPPGLFGDRCGGKCFPKCTADNCDKVHGCLFDINNDSKKSTADIDQFLYSSRVYLTTSEKTVVGVPISENNTGYLMAGLGSVISLFLFMIMMQLCKRSKYSERRIVVHESCAKTDTCTKSDTLSQHPRKEIKNKRYNYKSLKERQNRSPYEPEYAEIQENVETHVSNHSEVSFDYEQPILFSKNMPVKPENVNPTNGGELEKRESEAIFNMNVSDIYIEPI